MYWTDSIANHLVEANYDGTGAMVLQSIGITDLSPLTINQDGMKLFFIT